MHRVSCLWLRCRDTAGLDRIGFSRTIIYTGIRNGIGKGVTCKRPFEVTGLLSTAGPAAPSQPVQKVDLLKEDFKGLTSFTFSIVEPTNPLLLHALKRGFAAVAVDDVAYTVHFKE